MNHRIAKAASAVALAIASLGCAELKPPLTCPAHGGAPWTEIASKHFTLRTDLAPESGREVVKDLEGIYTMFKDVAFPSDRDPHDQIDVVIFDRREDYAVVGPSLSERGG